MKKIAFLLIFAMMIAASGAGCADKDETMQPGPDGGTENQDAEGQDGGDTEPSADEPLPSPDDGIDLDLVKMDEAEAYGLAYDIMAGDHLGKTVRIRGPYSYYEYDGDYYHSAYVTDEQACCAAFVEFRWVGDNTFPDDYPEENIVVEFVGVVKTYELFDLDWCYVEIDELTITGIVDTRYLEWGAA